MARAIKMQNSCIIISEDYRGRENLGNLHIDGGLSDEGMK
jgi:hypothetical protein